MNRRAALLAVLGLAGCAAVPEVPPEHSNDELEAALDKALTIMAAQDKLIGRYEAKIKEMRNELSVDRGCT